MKKVVIAIDSFKGCLPSAEAGKAAAEGIRSVFPKCEILSLPIADGGENADDLHRAGFRGVYSINPPSITLEQAMQPEVARANISETVVEICHSF